MPYKKNGYKYKMQPIVIDKNGTPRFAENRIISKLLEVARIAEYDLNCIHMDAQEGKFSIEEIEQFNQLIGYSVSGFGEISCHRGLTIKNADKKGRKATSRKEIMSETVLDIRPFLGKNVEVRKISGALYEGVMRRVGVDRYALVGVTIINKHGGRTTPKHCEVRPIKLSQIQSIKILDKTND